MGDCVSRCPFCLAEIRPIPLATIRHSLAAFLVLGWLLLSRAKVSSLPHLARFILCGLFGFTLYGLCINIGQTTAAAGATSFIVNIIPTLTVRKQTVIPS